MHATALEPRPGALTGLHARRRRRERAQHSLKVVVASLLRAHDVEVRGRRAGPCAHELLAGRAKHLYWQFKHATRILDVIMLHYPVEVRPMPGMWVQSVLVTAIPCGRMKTEQRNSVIRSLREDD